MLSLLYYVFLSLPFPLIFTVFGTVVLTGAMYWKSLISKRSDSLFFVYKESTLTKYVLTKCKTMTSVMHVPFWARSAHVQTLLPHVMPKAPFYFDREYILMKDRGIVALDWGLTGTDTLGGKTPILIIIPDIIGDTCDMTHLANTAVHKGFRPVVFIRRGHGECPLTTPKMQTFGDPSDLRQTIKYIRGNYPGCKLTALSMGAGSGLLLSYLGEYGSSTHLSAGVCVSPLFDAESVYNSCLPQPYDFLILLKKKRVVSSHIAAFRKSIDIDAAMRANSLAQFEDLFYGKSHGYQNREDYWEKNNPIRDVDDISVPVLCISSSDDPVYGVSSIPYDLFRTLPNFMLVQTERGGHCGFLHGSGLEFWADIVALEYLTAVSSFLDKTTVQDIITQKSTYKRLPRVLNRISF